MLSDPAHIDTDLDQLVALQRITFGDAARLQQWIYRTNVTVAIIAIGTIFVTNTVVIVLSTIIAFLLVVLSAYFRWALSGHRRFAEKVRKATLLSKGLGCELSSTDRRSIRASFKGDDSEVETFLDPDYYASTAPTGTQRLAEMLEESAFHSEYIARKCANKSWVWFGAFLIAAIVIFVAIVAIFTKPAAPLAAQVFLMTLTLSISKDFLGAAINYTNAAMSLQSILERLKVLKKGGDDLKELLFIFSDYNSTVEEMPLFIPGIHEKEKQKLNDLWQKYSAQYV